MSHHARWLANNQTAPASVMWDAASASAGGKPSRGPGYALDVPVGSRPYVAPVVRSEFEQAGGVLARAFYDTKQWTAVFGDPDVRERKLAQMFTGLLAMTSAAKGVAERTSGMEAVAVWLPPGRHLGLGAMVRSGFASARFAMTPPFVSIRRLTSMLRQFDKTRQRLMPVPHWYLLALGVEPGFQRYGYGPLLVRHGVQRADPRAVPTYVETEVGPNVAIYRKLGFDEIEQLTIDAYDLHFSVMVRSPLEAPAHERVVPGATP